MPVNLNPAPLSSEGASVAVSHPPGCSTFRSGRRPVVSVSQLWTAFPPQAVTCELVSNDQELPAEC